MMDYRGLEALHSVISHNSFEVAAQKLCISQSAVSQRIKACQSYYGDPLILRTSPYSSTPLGTKLLIHFEKVRLLEKSLDASLNQKEKPTAISMAINRDGLEIWFNDLLVTSKLLNEYRIEIITCDEEHTTSFLKNGIASICFSSRNDSIPNCTSELAGYMEYLLVCSPSFKQQYFPETVSKKAIIKAPALLFDKTDTLHGRFLAKYFNIADQRPPYHLIPSVKSFKEVAKEGFACALIPRLDIEEELSSGALYNLLPNKSWKMPYYLHHWEFGEPKYKKFVQLMLQGAKKILAYSSSN